MTCTHCDAETQRGRFCVGCGRRLLPQLQPMRPVPRRPQVDLDLTQPVLRLDRVPRPRVPESRGATAGGR
jgi:hypothetical protein